MLQFDEEFIEEILHESGAWSAEEKKRGATFNYRLMCVDTSVEGLMSDHDVPDAK